MAHESGIRRRGVSPLFGPEMLADPYPVYRQLRETDPVHWHEPFQAWVLTRYDDIVTVAHDPGASAARMEYILAVSGRADLAPFFTFAGKRMVSTDPPQHTRLRGILAQAFKPHIMEALRPHIQTVVDGFLDRVQHRGEMDAVADLAFPLPATIIMELLGVPPADRDRVKEWSDEFMLVFASDPRELKPDQLSRGSAGALHLRDYFRAAVVTRRAKPENDMLSLMIHAEEDGHKLDDEELLANAQFLLVAGHETTTNLIANGLRAMLGNPDQLLKLRADPALMPTAVEECLRYESPVQFMTRVVKKAMTVGGKQFHAGQAIDLLLGAANRDPAQFPDPDRFDVTRSPNKHLAFGGGAHFCLGAFLARLEATVAFETLLRRFPNMRLATTNVTYRENFNLRGPKVLPVRF